MNKPETLLVFDLETVVDVDVCASFFGCSCRDLEQCCVAIEHYHFAATDGRNSFPKQLFHRVITVGYGSWNIERDNNRESFVFRSLNSIGACDNDSEYALLKSFFSLVKKHEPRMVSFNGRGFDISVLKYRAMKYSLDCGAIDQYKYNHRYNTEWHCDLADVLSDFGASSKNTKLAEVCALIGVPGKVGVDGSEVFDMYQNGQIAEILDYCETDVLSTFLVYLRYMLRLGRMSSDSHYAAMIALQSYIIQHGGKRLKEFNDVWATTARDPGSITQ